MASRRIPAGAGILTGPDEPGKVCPSIGAALSGALTAAARALEPCTYYVRDADNTGRYAVELRDDRIVTVTDTHRNHVRSPHA